MASLVYEREMGGGATLSRSPGSNGSEYRRSEFKNREARAPCYVFLTGETTSKPGTFQEKEKTNSGYKHNNKVSHGIFNLTFCMLQHTSSEVTVTKYEEI